MLASPAVVLREFYYPPRGYEISVPHCVSLKCINVRETCFFLYDNKIADFEVWIPSEHFGPEMVPSSCIVKKLSAITTQKGWRLTVL